MKPNLEGTVFQTSSATASQVAASFTTVENTGYLVYMKVLNISDDNFDEVGSYGRVATFKNDGGTLTQVGTTTSLWTHEDVAGRDVAFDINGEDIEIDVTPDSATTQTWLIDLEIKEITGYNANSGWEH